MNPHPELEKQLNWLLNHSLQAGLLVLLVLAVQWIFRSRLTSRWRFALWWIVVARLVLPFSPESALSLYNFVHPKVQLEGPRHMAAASEAPAANNAAGHDLLPMVSAFPGKSSAVENVSPPLPTTPAANLPEAGQTSPPAAISRHRLSWDDFLIPGLAGLWLAGVMGLSGVVASQLIRFHRKLARASAPSDPGLQNLLDDCRREFGVSRQITLLETDAVQSPALFGLRRLRLLLPRGIGEQFARGELRYIFLHETAHVKRGDLWLNWLVTALQILHWFNPLLWLGFARLRADRELACDELALLRVGDNAGTAYGETVVKLLENLSRPAAIPGLVGILEDKKQMRRRIMMIVNFRRPGRWSALAVILIAAVAAAALTDAQTNKSADASARIKVENSVAEVPTSTNVLNLNTESDKKNGDPATTVVPPDQGGTASAVRPDLSGIVSAQGGAPLSVPATVFIATAAPKTGSSTFCPSCYADCVKHARTDSQGNFKIESLDPQLTFRILAVAKGFQPKFVSKVDPVNGTPVKIELQPIESADAAPEHSLRGSVVNAEGHAVEGAVVEMSGIETRDGGGEWGSIDGVDPLAVTDERGEFLITAKRPFDTMDVKVSARTFADKLFTKVPKGAPNKLVITDGASLTGRVLSQGQPLAGVSVGVSAVERQSQKYLGHFEIATGPGGRFLLANLPPDADFWLYTLMDTMKQYGAVPIQKIHTGKDDESTDAGDLVAMPAHRVAGRVILADGGLLPEKTRMVQSREEAWDSLQLTLDPNGNFNATNVPDEMITLSLRLKGYHVSARNLSLDALNPYRLIGKVDRDITNLDFLFEKGPEPRPDYGHMDPDYNESRTRPLRGAEGAPDHSREWAVVGHVVDADSGQPIQDFLVTPGQSQNLNQIVWSTLHAVHGSNGEFQVYVNKRAAEPALKVDADGYLPQVENLEAGSATNVDFALRKGSGPAGTVLAPDGTPDAGATLIAMNGDFNRASLRPSGDLRAYGNQSALHKTDAAGHFAMKPEWGVTTLVVVSSNGFALSDIGSLATNPVIQLQAFGQVSGTLTRTSGPGTNEDLDVQLITSTRQTGLNFELHAVTDSAGRFRFDGLPPGHLQISYRSVMDKFNNGWQNVPIKEFDLKPGQSQVLNIKTDDRPGQPAAEAFQPPPAPKLIAGVQLKGVVLRPDGKPAADADVALQVEGKYLALSKGRFAPGSAEAGLVVGTGPDGSFTLPMYDKAQSVVALSEDGYAQVSVDQLRASPQIRLQKWGRIEGTLRVGHHPGTNETLTLNGRISSWSMTASKAGQTNALAGTTNSTAGQLRPPFYDPSAFASRTDDQGRFAITFVPPGEQVISRKIPINPNSATYNSIATVEVQPGETVVTNLGGTGRTVTGKFKFQTNAPPDLEQGYASITTPMSQIYKKARELRTEEERQALYSSAEAVEARKNFRSFSVAVQSDGSFRAEDVTPGAYEVNFQQRFMPDAHLTSVTMFSALARMVVPPAASENDDSIVDWGTVELNAITLPEPKAPTAPK